MHHGIQKSNQQFGVFAENTLESQIIFWVKITGHVNLIIKNYLFSENYLDAKLAKNPKFQLNQGKNHLT